MAINLALLVRQARQTATSLGLTGRATITRPPAINGATGLPSGATLTQTVDAIEMTGEQRARQAGEAWTRATLGLFIVVADLAWLLDGTERVTWGGVTYQVVARETSAPTGAALTLAVGLAL